jgi:hypothetical protein
VTDPTSLPEVERSLAGPVLSVAGTVLALGVRMSHIGSGERVVAGLADRGGQVRAALEHAIRENVRDQPDAPFGTGPRRRLDRDLRPTAVVRIRSRRDSCVVSAPRGTAWPARRPWAR